MLHVRVNVESTDCCESLLTPCHSVVLPAHLASKKASNAEERGSAIAMRCEDRVDSKKRSPCAGTVVTT